MEVVPGVSADSPVLLLEDVHKVYNPGSPLQVPVLKGVSLSVEANYASAAFNATPWNVDNGLPNCSRPDV